MNFDVMIIGGGAAGLSAALWCDDLGLSAVLLEKDAELGGQLLWTYNAVKNHLGIEAASGRELRDAFVRQVEDRKFSIRLGAEIADADLANGTVRLASGEQIAGRATVIATGVRRRKLGVKGEDEFRGRGVLTSGKRDRETVRGKKAVIVGGGDAALENALILAETAASVTLIHRREEFRARSEFLEPARKNPKIEFLTNSVVKQISGDRWLEAVELENSRTGESRFVPADAVLIRVGVEPNTDFLRKSGLEIDEKGYVKIDALCRTNLKNVWAIGDVANPVAPTVSSAVGMGATAVKDIGILLNR